MTFYLDCHNIEILKNTQYYEKDTTIPNGNERNRSCIMF